MALQAGLPPLDFVVFEQERQVLRCMPRDAVGCKFRDMACLEDGQKHRSVLCVPPYFSERNVCWCS
jgi:hypothetical protein